MKLNDIVKGGKYIHKHPNGGIAVYKVKDILSIPTAYTNTKGKYNQKKPTITSKLIIQLVCLRDGSQCGVNNLRGFICKHEGE